jgi:hypothetical protein
VHSSGNTGREGENDIERKEIRKNVGSNTMKGRMVKLKLSTCLTNSALRDEDVWWNGCIYPHFLDIGSNWS